MNRFLEFIKSHNLFSPKDKILLAVSGGIDSMTMCHLFKQAGFNYGIAHCNFKLREKESDDDEQFVRKYADKSDVSFYSTSFDTKKYADKHGISVQMAAREFRYQWLENIRKKYNYQYIAVAHHSDDEVETFFINLLRGTGIAGLHGISVKRDNIIRPLLFTNRKEIVAYIKKHKIDFREDSSNKSDKYLRNKIRHQLFPVLKKICPNIKTIINNNIRYIKDMESIALQHIKQKTTIVVTKKNKQIFISISELKKLEPLSTFLFEILRPYNFSGNITKQIVLSLDSISGKQFFSKTHCLTKDRNNLIIEQIDRTAKNNEVVHITMNTTSIKHPVNMTFKIIATSAKQQIPTASTIAWLDFDLLTFPLILRSWKKGDKFYPLGMNKQKKLSDFLIDKKIPLSEKKKIVVLCSDDKIVWVVEHRIDQRFRISAKTKKNFQIKLIYK